ncbi:MAG TPA: hypothetical protein VLF20_02040 [Patescibacteria group bacterium]|nr:hypothetical protein [Patescibacteria group bacterium]
MNPTAPQNQLDPKLQETYNKVMGTQAVQPAAGASPAPDQATQQSITPPAVDPTQSLQPNQYTQDNLSFQAAIQTPPANTGAQQGQMPLAGVVPPPKQSSSFIGILIVIGAIVFFGAYTFIWMIIFNVPVPFLSF